MEHILIVDDDQTFSSILGRALKRRGYEVIISSTIEGALKSFKKYKPSKTVLDLKLKKGPGLSLIDQFINIEPSTKILILTGYSSISTAVEAIKMGAKNYLCKPADVSEILAAFEENLETWKTESKTLAPATVNRVAWNHIQKVLSENKGNISATARALKMHRRTLQRKLLKKPYTN